MIIFKKIFFLLPIVLIQQTYTQQADNLSLANDLLNTGNLYALNHNFDAAATTYKKIIALFPHSAAVLYNLGYALNELTEYQAAANAFEQACTLQPTPGNYLAFATALLALGDYEKGWKIFEHRWDLPDKKNISLSCPRWDGKSPLNKKKILLLNEGALGDCLQFIRYTELIKKQGAYVIVLVPAVLAKLCTLCPFIDEIISSGNPIPSADYYTSLMSLPALLGTTRTTIPTTIPYLEIDQLLFDHWKNILASDTLLKIGICWQADLTNDANRPPNARRSIPTYAFYPLSCLPQISLYSLQFNEDTPPYMHDFGPSLDTAHGRFMDSTAIICNLDLVITVDTAIAHLSGALGVPTWLILPYKADWRWMKDTDISPWYPTMRIFRASHNESWESLLSTIADTLSLSLTSHQGS